MTNYETLIHYFEQFPGIGSRQAKRFINHLLVLPEEERQELSNLIANISTSVATCQSCFRFFSPGTGAETTCSICSSQNRDRSKLMVLERDSDLISIERAKSYDGLYFVLGGTIPLLNQEEKNKLRGGALKATVETRASENGLSEIILAFSISPDGENTARYVRGLLEEIITSRSLTCTTLGRGLSTGSELEYADPETIKNALSNRG